MPELPEVQTIVSQLSQKIIGKKVSRLKVVSKACVGNPHGFDLQSLGTVKTVERRGKFIIIGFDKKIKAVVHLRMTGKLVWEEDSRVVEPRCLRAEFVFAEGGRLLFYSVRGFARLDLWSEEDKVPGLEKLGLEPFDRRLDVAKLQKMMAGRKVAIKSFLLNQELIAGIGNIYACEILYRTGVHPLTPAGSVSPQKVAELLQNTRSVLAKAVECCGTTVSDYRGIDDKTGQFQNFLQVYQKKCCPKGHSLQKLVVAGRGTYFCPVCQKFTPETGAKQIYIENR